MSFSRQSAADRKGGVRCVVARGPARVPRLGMRRSRGFRRKKSPDAGIIEGAVFRIRLAFRRQRPPTMIHRVPRHGSWAGSCGSSARRSLPRSEAGSYLSVSKEGCDMGGRDEPGRGVVGGSGVPRDTRDNAIVVAVAALIAATIIGGKLLRWF